MEHLVPDKNYIGIQGAYRLLDTLGETHNVIIKINRSYIHDDYININFNFHEKKYLLSVANITKPLLECEVWNTHNKAKILVKQQFSREEFLNGKFATP